MSDLGERRHLCLQATRMERGELSKVLPVELVEKIIAMIPFPYLYKAKALSKSWSARFSPISSLRDREEKWLATSFQKLVIEASTRWPSLFLVSITGRKEIFGHNPASWKRQTLPSLLPVYDLVHMPFLRINGALLYGFHDRTDFLKGLAEKQWEGCSPLPPLPNSRNSICVANLLTREWTQVEPLPKNFLFNARLVCLELVSDASSGTYKLIAVHRVGEEHNYSYIHIFDSKSKTWSSNKFFSGACHIGAVSLAYLDGVVYMVRRGDWAGILAFNVEKGSLEELEELKRSIDDRMNFKGHNALLAVSNGKLVMIMRDRVYRSTIHVLQIDLESQSLREVAQCDEVDFKDIMNSPISETDCIIYRYTMREDLLLTHNKQKDAWSFFSLNTPPSSQCRRTIFSAFQPRLNPFMAV